MSGPNTVRGPRNQTVRHNLIVLDDNPGWGNFVSDVAEKVGYTASYATSQADFVATAKAEPPDVVVLDLFMPDKDGIEMIMDLAGWEHRPFIVLISGQSNALLTSAVRLGRSKGLEVVGSLVKPFRMADLRALLHRIAGLVEKRRKLGKKIAANGDQETPEPQADAASVQDDGDKGVGQVSEVVVGEKFLPPANFPQPHEASSLKVLKDQLVGNPSGDNVKRSIAAINARFCLALWQTHLAALTALIYVPSRLAEAAAALIASRQGTKQASGWRQAVRTNMRTLANSQALIREVANSLYLVDNGQSAIWSIDRLNAIVSEIQVLKHTRSGSLAKMLTLYREISAVNEELKQDLELLFSGLKEAIDRGEETRGMVYPGKLHSNAIRFEDNNRAGSHGPQIRNSRTCS